MYVVHEGYEGLVRGNVEGPKRKVTLDEDVQKQQAEEGVEDKLINNPRRIFPGGTNLIFVFCWLF